ncbi:MAG: YebC/PmpR family DNA-binding transcriptional regulator [Candidatus Gracilibacteria bacterium]
MARHSHWAQIKLKKGATDKKRGKIFTKHAHLIETAVRKAGGDPGMNASLRLAIDNARADNMPRENIDRAIKKGLGTAKGAEQMQEVTYEGFAPGGVALLIETLTDNKNRTNQAVRNVMQKNGGNMGAMGSTSFLFDVKGMINVKAKGNRDDDEMEIIDAGAQDLQEIDGGFLIYTAPNELGAVRKKLEGGGFKIESAELTKIPKNLVDVNDPAIAKKILNLMELLEEEDDVLSVAANFDIPEGLLE